MLTFTRYYIDSSYDLDHIEIPIFNILSYDECKEVIVIHVLKDKIICLYDEKDYIKQKYCCVIENNDLDFIKHIFNILHDPNIKNTKYYDMIEMNDVNYMTKEWKIYHDALSDTIELNNVILFNIPSIYKTNMSMQISYNDIYNWYSTNKTDLQYFTQNQNVQYLYVFLNKNTKRWTLSLNPGLVSLEFKYINDKHSNILQSLFSGKKMYLQINPNDLYFVVPKLLNGKLFGDHYRIHLIQNYKPDCNASGQILYNDVIDIHRTNFYYNNGYYKSNHNPKCVFENNTLLFIKNEKLEFDNIKCFNKRPTGNDIYKTTFTDLKERDLIEDILQLPYKEIIKKHLAAMIIQRQWSKYLEEKKKRESIQVGQRGGLYTVKNNNTKKYFDKIELDLNMPLNADYMHIICLKNNNDWNYNYMIYDEIGNEIKTGCYESKSDDHIDNMNSYF